MTVKVGFLHTLIRPEEKYLLAELNARKNVSVEMIDVRMEVIVMDNLRHVRVKEDTLATVANAQKVYV